MSGVGIKLVTPVTIKNPLSRLFVLGTASGLGLGYAPVAPGTFGSLLGIPLGLWLIQYPTWLSLIVCAILLALFIPVADRAGIHWGNRDSGRIVIDEVLGQALAILGAKPLLIQFLPQTSAHTSLAAHFENAGVANFLDIINSITEHKFAMIYIGISFGLFRLFDITKPSPARAFDNKPSGWGVMMDDVVAGLYAALVMRLIAKIVL